MVSDRLASIQWLRGLAAMLVVANHASMLALENSAPHARAVQSSLLNLAYLGGIGVDLFFIISGFVMALTARRFAGVPGALHFLLQRYNRIAPLYYLLCAVLVLEAARSGTPIAQRELMNSLTFVPWFDFDTYSWPVHYLGWTLAFEFVFYGIVAVLIATGFAHRPRSILAVTLVLPTAGLVFGGDWVPWQMLTSPLMWEFALGVLLYIGHCRGHVGHRGRLRPALPLLLAAAFAAALLPAFTDWPVILNAATRQFDHAGATWRFVCWGLPAFVIVACCLSLPGRAESRAGRLLLALGDASYSIYLTHLFVVRLALEAIERLGLDPVAAMVAVLVLAPPVGLLAYRWLERPLLRSGQSLIGRLRPSRPETRAVAR